MVGFLRKGGVKNGESEAGAELPAKHPVRHFIVAIEKELGHPQAFVLKIAQLLKEND